MTHLLILAGSDRVGKSTYAEYIAKLVNGCCGKRAEVIHFGPPDATRDHPFHLYYDQIDERDPCLEWEIWDRSHLCSLALEPWRRGRTLRIGDFMSMGEDLEAVYETIVICTIYTPWNQTVRDHHIAELTTQNCHPEALSYKLQGLRIEHQFYYNTLGNCPEAKQFAKFRFAETAYSDSSEWATTRCIKHLLDCDHLYPGMPC